MPYTKLEVIQQSYKFRGYIKNCDELEDNKLYELYATGDADLDGRKWVAIEINKNIDCSVKTKYNLI